VSDHFMPPRQPPLMTAAKARDIGRAYKAFAEMLADAEVTAEAARAERDSRWWLTYAQVLAQTPPEDER
jgi:hypothetical protein